MESQLCLTSAPYRLFVSVYDFNLAFLPHSHTEGSWPTEYYLMHANHVGAMQFKYTHCMAKLKHDSRESFVLYWAVLLVWNAWSKFEKAQRQVQKYKNRKIIVKKVSSSNKLDISLEYLLHQCNSIDSDNFVQQIKILCAKHRVRQCKSQCRGYKSSPIFHHPRVCMPLHCSYLTYSMQNCVSLVVDNNFSCPLFPLMESARYECVRYVSPVPTCKVNRFLVTYMSKT